MSSQKSETVKPLTTGIKPFVNPEFRKPDWNIKRTDPYANPMYNSFSIFDAVGILYNLLKNLFKKSDAVEPARIMTVQDLTLDFKFRDADANPLEMKVDLKLRSRTLPVSF
jgi:hypothetical protein